jgi:predicted MPP superfamily phosphohydrolase
MNQRPSLTRRRFLRTVRNALLTTGLLTASGCSYSTLIEPGWLTVKQVTLPIQRLPAAFDGFRIAQISDLHLYPVTQLSHIQATIAEVNRLRPDLIVITGDLVQARADAIFELAPALTALNAPHGVYTILGNHDLWTNATVVRQGLAESRMPLLLNTGVELTRGAARLFLAGLDDGWSGRPDLQQALAPCPADLPAILLMHEPDFADRYASDPRLVLQLSGHTHGGQVRLPGIGALVLPRYGRKYDLGLYRVGSMWLYTNPGIGLINPPFRFNCRPEITELTLIAEEVQP